VAPPANGLTENKRENEKLFDLEKDMSKTKFWTAI
jgi:hypothetical protein